MASDRPPPMTGPSKPPVTCAVKYMLIAQPDLSRGVSAASSGMTADCKPLIAPWSRRSPVSCQTFCASPSAIMILRATGWLGVIMIARTNVMVSIICIIFGIYVLADALLKVQIAIDAKAFGISKWWLILAVAILTGVAGFLLVLRPSESAQILMVLLGLSLISEGLLNLITILTAVKIIRRQRPEIIDTDTAE